MHLPTFILCFSLLLLPSESNIIDTFEKYKKFFHKSYKNAKEEVLRETNFNRSVERIKRLSLEKPHMKFRLNDYSDMSDTEWNAMFPFVEKKTKKKTRPGSSFFSGPETQETLPDSIDWRGWFGDKWPVETQGTCGFCYAFAALAVIEAKYALAKNLDRPPNLSKQEIVDCTLAWNNVGDDKFSGKGCDKLGGKGGGLRDDVYKYVQKYGVYETSVYPYKAYNETCKRDVIRNEVPHLPRYYIDGFRTLSYKGITDRTIQKLLVHGPISSGIFFHPDTFRDYGGDVITDTYLWYDGITNHAVAIVGYGHDDEQDLDYWLIRNSMGPSWGDNGYFRVERGYNAFGLNIEINYMWILDEDD